MKKVLIILLFFVLLVLYMLFYGGVSVSISDAEVRNITVEGTIVVCHPLDSRRHIVADYSYCVSSRIGVEQILAELEYNLDRRDLLRFFTKDCDDAFYSDFVNYACVSIKFVDGEEKTYYIRSLYCHYGLYVQSLSHDSMFTIGLDSGEGFTVHSTKKIEEILCGTKPDWLVIDEDKISEPETPEEFMQKLFR